MLGVAGTLLGVGGSEAKKQLMQRNLAFNLQVGGSPKEPPAMGHVEECNASLALFAEVAVQFVIHSSII